METLLHKAHSIGSAMYNGRTRTTTMSTKNHDDIVALPLKSETWPMCAVCLCAYRIVSYRIGSGLCCERAFLPSNATSIKWFITAFFGRSENCYRSFLLTTHTFIFIPWYRCCAMPLCYEMLWLCSSLAKKKNWFAQMMRTEAVSAVGRLAYWLLLLFVWDVRRAALDGNKPTTTALVINDTHRFLFYPIYIIQKGGRWRWIDW